MNIGIDMMGGDFAPLEAVKGVKLFLEGQGTRNEGEERREKGEGKDNHDNIDNNYNLTLFGDKIQIESLLKEHAVDTSKIKIIGTSQVIDMHEHPTKAMKEKQDSSIAVGFGYLAKGHVDAFISAGNTGAM
ncbi:MAG: hypothetical protein ACKOBX_08145, partial [Bacteroidota bacterium]